MALNLRTFISNWRGYFLIKRSGLFDAAYYLEQYPAARKASQNPIMHYITTGWREGKNPSPDFDTAYYLRENKDVRVARINPLVHYIQFGKAEGRPPNRSLSKDPYTYYAWIEDYDTLTDDDLQGIRAHTATFQHQPLISILMPVYNTPEPFLRAALDSVLAQTYPNWECCIADDASTEPHVRQILDGYAQQDRRFKVTYRQTNGHISAASNTALSLANGDYIGLLDHDDVLREHALYMVVDQINHFPAAEIIYSDEDLIDEFSVRYDPYFKPDWNPDLFYGHNLITHFGIYRTDRVRKVGGFRQGYEGAQDWDLAMRISELVPTKSIRHIPHILYHWRAVIGSTALSSEFKGYARDAQLRTLESHFQRKTHSVEITLNEGEFWRVKHLIPDLKPLVSIIIPTRDQPDYLRRCLDSILQKTEYENYEILVVDNQSEQQETLEYFNEIKSNKQISILDYDYAFNYSGINNFAAQHAQGDVLLFLNDDTEVISQDWLDEMAGHALRPQIGAVGAMLYYPKDTIQHAGVILGMKGIAGHIYYGSPRGTIGQRGRARLAQNFSAVTAACMAVEKSKFFEINGFNEQQLAVAYNDIDLCLQLVKAGYRNLWTPHAELYHHESASRSYEDTPEKLTRFKTEAAYLVERWEDFVDHDPTYNPNLSLTIPNFSLAFPPRTEKPWLQFSKKPGSANADH